MLTQMVIEALVQHHLLSQHLRNIFLLRKAEFMQNAKQAYWFIVYFLKAQPTPEAEPILSKSTHYSWMYASQVLHGPFLLGEPAIQKSDWYSSIYYASFPPATI